MDGIVYRDNLIERCVYSIEYFLEIEPEGNDSYMKNIVMKNNILRHAGEGWGQQRHNKHTPAHIKGWSYVNTASDYLIEGNIFDRCAYRLLHLVAKEKGSCPVMKSNTYIQYEGGMLGQYGANAEAEPPILTADENTELTLKDVFGDENAQTYVVAK
jgi:predicted nucleic acid-binding Zn finger protein